MRIRSIKPAFWKSETMATVAKEYRLLAIALINYADDEGYFAANEALIRGECFPFDEDSTSILRGLVELSNIGFLGLGKSDSGQRIGRITNFQEHQKIDRATPSKFAKQSIVWDQADTNSASPRRVIDEPSSPDTEVDTEVLCVAASAPLIELPMIGGKLYGITQAMVDVWTPAYPAVAVMRELHAMVAWLRAHPKNQKTKAGMPKFITGWLGRAQDKAPPRAPAEKNPWEGAK